MVLNPDQWWHRFHYEDWVTREGLELLRGRQVDDVFTVPLRYWPRTEGNAVQIELDGSGERCASYVQEIPAGRKLTPQRHLFEELVFVLSGRGSTSVWYDEDKKRSFEWGPGSLFAVPLNAWHQHFNNSGADPARYIALTTAPEMMNFLRNDDFIFNNDYRFTDRFNQEDDYFNADVQSRQYERMPGVSGAADAYFANLWTDVYAVYDRPRRRNREFDPTKDRSLDGGSGSYQFELANGVLGAHIFESDGGTFTSVHRHGPASHVLWLKGEGYSILWPDGGENNKHKEDWHRGTLLVPPMWWWHGHCVTSQESARYIALKMSSRKNMVTRAHEFTTVSSRIPGGQSTSYADIPPATLAELKQIFLDECKKKGTPIDPRMVALIGE
ncbi:MAG: Gentisate 1,2-dioxygenase [Chloroflexi bacterium]|nr:Gentisate 1,2-dioxygenase [Chloroflexota bacterium]